MLINQSFSYNCSEDDCSAAASAAAIVMCREDWLRILHRGTSLRNNIQITSPVTNHTHCAIGYIAVHSLLLQVMWSEEASEVAFAAAPLVYDVSDRKYAVMASFNGHVHAMDIETGA
jgi:hypothetical protein